MPLSCRAEGPEQASPGQSEERSIALGPMHSRGIALKERNNRLLVRLSGRRLIDPLVTPILRAVPAFEDAPRCGGHNH